MLSQLIEYNKEWAKEQKQTNGSYFDELAKGQAPEYLWIGCADSRVPAESLLGVDPGQLFVHRNVGNQIKPADGNAMSVLQYAVKVLHVKHIIVCGHSGCGGVKSAMQGVKDGFLQGWLSELRELSLSTCMLKAESSEEDKLSLLTDQNVMMQVENLKQSHIVKTAWKQGQKLAIHGWVFDIEEGLIRDLEISADRLEDENL
ncbi:MAG: carbonic anhydrase [Sinobacterium sp.]|nr:carbonic anhydrase [Sinobacterium sp.]